MAQIRHDGQSHTPLTTPLGLHHCPSSPTFPNLPATLAPPAPPAPPPPNFTASGLPLLKGQLVSLRIRQNRPRLGRLPEYLPLKGVDK